MFFLMLIGFAFLIAGVLLLAAGLVLAFSSLATLAIVVGFFAFVWWLARKDWGISRRIGPIQRARPQSTQGMPLQYVPHHKHFPRGPSSMEEPTHETGSFDPWGIV